MASTPNDPSEFRRLLRESRLGDPEAQAIVERYQRWKQALPERWVRLSESDLVCLLDIYRERYEAWNEDHDTVVARVLIEVDFEPSQSDLDDLMESRDSNEPP